MKIKPIATKTAIYCVCMLAASTMMYGTMRVQALIPGGGNAGGGSVPGGGNGCAKNNPTAISQSWDYQDDCVGVSWRYYKVKNANDNHIYIAGGSDGVVKGGYVDGCGPYGGYYRLAYERFNAGKVYSTIQDASLGYQIGLVPVYYVEPQLGSTAGGVGFVYDINKSAKSPKDGLQSASDGIYKGGNYNGAMSWGYVQERFQEAKDYAAKNPGFSGNLASKKWNEIAWFCWSPGFAEKDPTSTSFNGYSIAYTEEGGRISAGPDTDKTQRITTDKDYVTIDFDHRLTYVNGDKQPDTVGNASTNWTVKVTHDNSVITHLVDAVNGGGANTKDRCGSKAADGPCMRTRPSRSAVFKGTLSVKGNSNTQWDHNLIGGSRYTVDLSNMEDGQKTIVCSEISYNPKNISWKKSGKNYVMDTAKSSDSGKSAVCVEITRSKEEDPPEYDPSESKLEFFSTSAVKVKRKEEIKDLGNDIVDSSAYTEAIKDGRLGNDRVELYLSTDDDHIEADFWHHMDFKEDMQSNNDELPDSTDDDTGLENLCTKYHVVRTTTKIGAGGDATETVKNDTDFCTDGREQYKDEDWPKEASSESQSWTQNHRIDLEKGDTVKVCETIVYSPVSFSITREPVLNEEQTDFHHWNNTIGGSDDSYGASAACVVITRPEDPTNETNPDDGPYGPWIGPNPATSGTDNLDALYAGESSDAGWDVKAKAYKTRKIVSRLPILFQPSVDRPFDENISTVSDNEKRTNKNPCEFFTEKVGASSLRAPCKELTDVNGAGETKIPAIDSANIVEDADFSGIKKLVITDYVGDKYCTSFGYKWQFWYGVEHYKINIVSYNGIENVEFSSRRWDKEGDAFPYVYWTNYSAACRTVAKKPSISIWNGGVFSNGGLKTSVSPRHTKSRDDIVDISNIGSYNSNDRSSFGSWSEYLAVVAKQVKGFGSGASLAFNGGAVDNLLANSPLTISNTDSANIGNSGISSNSTFISRLESYITSAASSSDSNANIVVQDGDYVIHEGDTVTQGKTGSINTVYQLPQNIIYVKKGNIIVDENVKQVNAWLIAPKGVVKTCEEYRKPGEGGNQFGTEALYKGSNSSNAKCSSQLTINGPIVAQSLISNRTAGSDPVVYRTTDLAPSQDGGNLRSISGEVLNLSADTYLWAYAQAGRYSSSYTEAYSQELPPRY